jgi:peptide/nickel transport system substrate-binding protein
MLTIRTRATALSAAAAALALAAAGCGGSTTGGTPGPTQNSAASGYDAAIKGVVNPSAKTGGTLNFIADSDTDSYDPARTYYAFSWNLQRMFTRTLMAYDDKVGAAGAKVVPDLAAAPATVSADGRTYTYTLRSGLKFSNGEPITSQAVKYGIERIFAQDTLPGGPVYMQTFLSGYQGQASYPGPYKDPAPDHLGLKSVETPDATTIVFHLNTPFADFPYLLAIPDTAPVPIDVDQNPAVGGVKYANHVVSSGPYMFQSFQPGKQTVWVRNPNFDQASDPVAHQLADKVVLTIDTNDADMDQRLLNGSADLEIQSSGLQPAAQAKVLTSPALKADADAPPNGFTRYIAINQVVPELSNVHCREAVEFAADKVALQNARGGPVAGGLIATTMAPPTLNGYTKFDLYPSGPDNHGDLAAARQQLALCGVPNGFHTDIATTNTGKGPAVAQALQQGLARVGISTSIVSVDASTYYSTTIGTPSNVHKQDLGLMVAGWGSDFPTGYGFFSSIVDGRKILQSGGNSNYQETADPLVNSLLDKLTTATSVGQENQITGQLDKQVMSGATVLPFLYDSALNYRNPRLTNVYVTNAFGQIDFVSLGVDDGK